MLFTPTPTVTPEEAFRHCSSTPTAQLKFKSEVFRSGTDGEVTTGGVTTGTEPYTSGGEVYLSYPGQILLALGEFDNIATGGAFDTINTIDLVAEPLHVNKL